MQLGPPDKGHAIKTVIGMLSFLDILWTSHSTFALLSTIPVCMKQVFSILNQEQHNYRVAELRKKCQSFWGSIQPNKCIEDRFSEWIDWIE